jgi:predicted MPP superfamily phosphohydrolase
MVGGSHDYYEPRVINPFKYLRGPSPKLEEPPQMPWRNLREAVRLAGWHWLENSAVSVETNAGLIGVVGVDDAHYHRDDVTKALAALSAQGSHFAAVLGVAHSPYLRVLDGLAAGGVDLIMAGHTHGGQIRLPGVGSLVTNCDLPNKYSRGLSRFADSWLHVSAGLGTSPFAPVRLGCPPEATLLELTKS